MSEPTVDALIKYFGGRCAVCHCEGVTIHEIHPKSLNPKNWRDPKNRIALCAGCHEKAHARGTRASSVMLETVRAQYAAEHGEFA